MKSTDWDAITKRHKKSQEVLNYMAEHPLTHNEAVQQGIKLKNMSLEDEIKRYTEEKYHETFENRQDTLDEFDWEDIDSTIEETARHFAEWGADHLRGVTKMVPDGLEEAAEEFYPDFSNSIASKAAVDSMRDAFKAGAKWDKVKMMEESVEGEISHLASVHYVKTNESKLFARLKQFKSGDKVHIIIVKEDEL